MPKKMSVRDVSAVCGQVFHDIAEQAHEMYQAGVPTDEAQNHYAVPDKFKNFPNCAWGFTVGPSIARLYPE